MKNRWKGCFRRSKLQNFLCLPTMMADRIFRHIPTDCLEFGMTAEKWNYVITMNPGIQNIISSAVIVTLRIWEDLASDTTWIKIAKPIWQPMLDPFKSRKTPLCLFLCLMKNNLQNTSKLYRLVSIEIFTNLETNYI